MTRLCLNPSWPWLCGARRGDAAASEGPLREEGRGGAGEEWTFGCEESDKDGKDFGAMDVRLGGRCIKLVFFMLCKFKMRLILCDVGIVIVHMRSELSSTRRYWCREE